MTRSSDFLRDLHLSEDKIKISNDTLIGVKGYGSLIIVFSKRDGGVTVGPEMVALVPELVFKLFALMAAHTQGVFRDG